MLWQSVMNPRKKVMKLIEIEREKGQIYWLIESELKKGKDLLPKGFPFYNLANAQFPQTNNPQ